ncbi:MAG TPA: DUF1688 family protein [Candidatus Sulfotelmatobacter sp.]|nr:DUF1688 family protein [Candidatus Sulfotelmatobacter sp.]
MNDVDAARRDPAGAATALLTAAAVRARCGRVMAAAEAGRLAHFAYHPERLDAAAAYVVDVIRARYPDLAVPYHSRWRHFEAGGVDRWRAPGAAVADPVERARARFDLAIVSVLLDAGAGPRWRYREAATGLELARSEGLAIASFRMIEAGGFGAPWRADAASLAALDIATVGRFFQVSDANPLVGLDGRVALMRRLGETIAANPRVFGAPARVGHLFDHLAAAARPLAAAAVLETVLRTLGPIWPSRLSLGGVALGDVWRHPAARTGDADDPSDGLVPFHKLSQWLTYSLLEPLEEAGVPVVALDALTGLPEYRNGGLLLDLGVLTPKDPALARTTLRVADEPVVEWRALTVIALDRLAERVRAELGLDAAGFPLAKVLEGGTWAAGRRIAAEARPGGPPPLTIESDGTVF